MIVYVNQSATWLEEMNMDTDLKGQNYWTKLEWFNYSKSQLWGWPLAGLFNVQAFDLLRQGFPTFGGTLALTTGNNVGGPCCDDWTGIPLLSQAVLSNLKTEGLWQ